MPDDFRAKSANVCKFLYWFLPVVNIKRSTDSCVCASSEPVFEKNAFVELTKSNLSAVFACYLGISIGCLIIVCES